MNIDYACRRCGLEFEIQVTPNGSDFTPDFCRKCSQEVDIELVLDLVEAALFDHQHAAGDRARALKQDRKAGL